MPSYCYRNGELFCEQSALNDIAAMFGTPCYVYSRQSIEAGWQAYHEALVPHPHLICYAVKANSNLAVLSVLAKLGSGFDVVSVGELERVLRAGGDPAKIVFAGVGKREDEMQRALAVGIRCFNVESEQELVRLNRVAGKLGLRAPVALRVNPDVDAETHPYISTGLKENKFGIAMDQAEAVFKKAAVLADIDVLGVACHIGSQLVGTASIVNAVERLMALVDRLVSVDIRLQHIDVGGGLGIRYRDEAPPKPGEYAQTVLSLFKNKRYELIIEPGRSIVGPSGVLLTRVEYIKHGEGKSFAVVDAAMNDLLRPALYDAWQDIVPVTQRVPMRCQTYDIVGPVCETSDFLGKERLLDIQTGDLLAVKSAGAYGFSMSSTYNSRPRVPEIMVQGEKAHLIRGREPLEVLWQGESLLPH